MKVTIHLTLVWIQSANVEEQSLDITMSRTSTFTDDFWFSRPIDILCTTFITNSRFWCLLQYNSSMWSKESRRARLSYYNTKKFSMIRGINANATIAVNSDVDCNSNLPVQKPLFTASSILKLYSGIEVWNAEWIKLIDFVCWCSLNVTVTLKFGRVSQTK